MTELGNAMRIVPEVHRAPESLAASVVTELRTRKLTPPDRRDLTRLFEGLYFASLRFEEGHSIVCHIVFLDPGSPDPDPPPRIRHDRWCYTPLADPIPFTVANIAKLAMATDPRTSSLVVYPDTHGALQFWGLVDQANRYYDFLNYDSDAAFQRPGILQASIAGVGHVTAHIGFEKLGELKGSELRRRPLDPLSAGPIRQYLEPGIVAHTDAVMQQLSRLQPKVEITSQHRRMLAENWLGAICRLLLRVQSYRHGGAVLVTPNSSDELNIKYGLDYRRLALALSRLAALRIAKVDIESTVVDKYFRPMLAGKAAGPLPMDLYLNQISISDNLADGTSEVDGAIWFVSLLTRVDGLVLMDSELNVKGFGVEITASQAPTHVYVATDRAGLANNLREVDYNFFGTRHRSMMRYCINQSGSVGFVVSQDGDVRAITSVGTDVVMWDNIRLQRRIRFRRSRPRDVVPLVSSFE